MRSSRPIILGGVIGVSALGLFFGLGHRDEGSESVPGDAIERRITQDVESQAQERTVPASPDTETPAPLDDDAPIPPSAMTTNRAREHKALASVSPLAPADPTKAVWPDQQASATFPEDAEARIWHVLSTNQQLNFTSIDRVVCRAMICEIRFTAGPDLSDIRNQMKLMIPLSNALPMSGWTSSRVQLSPGVYSSVFTLRSVIDDDLLKTHEVGKPQAFHPSSKSPRVQPNDGAASE